MKLSALYLIIGILTIQACNNSKPVVILDKPTKINETEVINNPQLTAPAIVYKTVKDYSDLVPVTMNNSKTKIISYPDPVDIYYNGELAKPARLKNGYYLDNRGINENTVFLKYTYEEYAAMKQAPSTEEMLNNIMNKYPLIEIVNCGARSKYTNETEDLNKLIDNDFKGCERTFLSVKFNP